MSNCNSIHLHFFVWKSIAKFISNKHSIRMSAFRFFASYYVFFFFYFRTCSACWWDRLNEMSKRKSWTNEKEVKVHRTSLILFHAQIFQCIEIFWNLECFFLCVWCTSAQIVKRKLRFKRLSAFLMGFFFLVCRFSMWAGETRFFSFLIKRM